MRETLEQIGARVPRTLDAAWDEAELLINTQHQRGVRTEVAITSFICALVALAGLDTTDQDEVNERLERMITTLRLMAVPLGNETAAIQ